MKLISAESGAHILFLLLNLPLVFIRSRSQVPSNQGPKVPSNFGQLHLYHLHLPLVGASIEIGKVGPLSLLWEALFSVLGKLCVCSLRPLHHLSCSVAADFQLYIFSDELGLCFKGQANLCERIHSLLLGADGSSV